MRHDENKEAAQKYLRKLTQAVSAELFGASPFLGPDVRRLSVNEILDKVEKKYEEPNEDGICRKVPPPMKSHLKRLRDFFGDIRAVSVDDTKVAEFKALLLSNGYAKATVNRSLQLFQQAYTVAKLPCPEIEKFSESDNVRKGKFTQVEAARVAACLPDYLADVARFAYETGSRAGEILKLRWGYVTNGVINVPGAITKSRKNRQIVITEELKSIIGRRRKARVADCDFIFHNAGTQIVDYRKAWHTACALNGLGTFYCRACENQQLDAKRTCPKCGTRWENPKYIGKLFHDFRRSAAHEMWRAGSATEECMEVTGHKTDSMFKRYADLFSDDERREMQRKVQERRHATVIESLCQCVC